MLEARSARASATGHRDIVYRRAGRGYAFHRAVVCVAMYHRDDRIQRKRLCQPAASEEREELERLAHHLNILREAGVDFLAAVPMHSGRTRE